MYHVCNLLVSLPFYHGGEVLVGISVSNLFVRKSCDVSHYPIDMYT